jgi:flagellar biogenesis protein FliO
VRARLAAGLAACALAGAAQAGPARLPLKPAAADGGLAARAVAALLGVAALAGAGAWMLKRSGRAPRRAGARPPALQRRDSMRLSTRTTLFVVGWQGAEWLLAEGEGGVRLLAGPAAPAQGGGHG